MGSIGSSNGSVGGNRRNLRSLALGRPMRGAPPTAARFSAGFSARFSKATFMPGMQARAAHAGKCQKCWNYAVPERLKAGAAPVHESGGVRNSARRAFRYTL
jgi:hypothetical protein